MCRRIIALNQVDMKMRLTPSERKNVPVTTVLPALATTHQPSYRRSRWHRPYENPVDEDSRAAHDDYDEDTPKVHQDDMSDSNAVSQAKTDYWGGYYDFLINEGSYKFWAVFQLATAALLIYSGFAALYYAKVNPQISNDYDDDFLLRRRRRSIRWSRPPKDQPFFGFDPQSFQRILDAIAQENYEIEA
ncbi:hypothetical protein QAD02_020211 [Eretmocerus hayati]|uniref:Uncharacterized protein n=1 Tax=Eretmocerus hayati TaxID=131215 RepID=A0ACC2PM93_9HYME|nr:hypothetical protein QAD02_020211 [Eretmocerus hayati]